MSGEIDMMLDDKTVHLQAGDVVVQQATNHAWINRGDKPCRMIFVLLDGKQPASVGGRRLQSMPSRCGSHSEIAGM